MPKINKNKGVPKFVLISFALFLTILYFITSLFLVK